MYNGSGERYAFSREAGHKPSEYKSIAACRWTFWGSRIADDKDSLRIASALPRRE